MENIPSARRRRLRAWIPGSETSELIAADIKNKEIKLIDLASNDYLGLSRHPKIIEAAQSVMRRDGVGAGGSRLVTGTRPIHQELEGSLANWLKRERVLVFPSGFQANLAAVICLANRDTPVIADKLIHHSLLIGVRASRAKLLRFAHNDLNDLEKKLKACDQKRYKFHKPLVITESLFSMEGTSPDIKEMTNLCAKHGAYLFIDEAHALGVMGEKGKGLSYGFNSSTSIMSGTFGKAFGGGGAFLACNSKIGESLLQTSGAFRYTTALAPPLAAAALEALNLIATNPHWGLEIKKCATDWRDSIAEEGWTRPPGNGQILSLLIGEDQEALNYQNQLEKSGLLSVAIRPPTVPEKTARLRLVIRRNLPKVALSKLIKTIKT